MGRAQQDERSAVHLPKDLSRAIDVAADAVHFLAARDKNASAVPRRGLDRLPDAECWRFGHEEGSRAAGGSGRSRQCVGRLSSITTTSRFAKETLNRIRALLLPKESISGFVKMAVEAVVGKRERAARKPKD
ncbi:hypothetical protein [Methylobacterium sp. WL9]|uniref:hypothetical protein n=1 Tax=Methylobacterium sp. WL9 TaxID=2603898 RepID=UPI00164F89FE|nr:hypothetical protein [Methylobacterium sp. WL9]